jgi:hypothetical protein
VCSLLLRESEECVEAQSSESGDSCEVGNESGLTLALLRAVGGDNAGSGAGVSCVSDT